MRQKLLHKILRAYIIFSAAMLLITAPAFYYFTRKWHYAEGDEALLLRLHEFEKFHLSGFHISDIGQWNDWNRDVKIEPKNPLMNKEQFSVETYPNIMENDLEPYRVLRAPIIIEGRDYVLFARVNLLDTMDMVYNMMALYLSILLLLLIGLYGITKNYAFRLWKPFYEVLEELERFEIDKSIPVNFKDSAIEEFHRLKGVAEKLISRNVAIFESQKEFIENAAHELQTPLAVMQAKLDNLFQLQPLTDKEAVALESLSNALSKLNLIHKNLLLLSRLDQDNFTEKQDTSIRELLGEHIEFLKEQATTDKIEIEVDLKDAVQVNCNEVLAEILCSNLLTNALKHNLPGGKIRVSLSGNVLTIENTGIPEALPANILFRRFSKKNPSSQGLGLGLAIAKKIADINHWDLQYQFQNNRHIFSVTF